MALQRDTHYPGRWTTGNAAHPQGAFKNRTAPGALDGSYIEQDWANDWDGYFGALLAAAGITANGTVDTATSSQYFNALSTVLKQSVASDSRVSGLIGANNTATPNTQFDFTADQVVLRDATSGFAVRLAAPLITVNILTAGPAINGRDQASAFTNGSWVHFWYIYNGATLAMISSASSTAPTLPAGYTYKAYAHAVYLGAGGLLTRGVIRGSWFANDLPIGAVNNGNATVLTSIPLTAIIPPNALQFEIYSPNLALTALASGAYNLQCNIVISGINIALQFGMQGTGAANAVTGVSGTVKRLQNINQNFAYQLVVGAGVGYIVTIGVTGYSVPNGGE